MINFVVFFNLGLYHILKTKIKLQTKINKKNKLLLKFYVN